MRRSIEFDLREVRCMALDSEIALSDQPCLFHSVDDPEEVSEQHCRTDIYVRVEFNEQEGNSCAQEQA